MVAAPTPSQIARIAALLGELPRAWRRVTGGYTPASRWVAQLAARSVFVKIATTPVTARMMDGEFTGYAAIGGPFVPRLVATEMHDEEPILIIEDLSYADWPPPWTTARVDAVLAALDALHRSHAPGLRPFADVQRTMPGGWQTVAEDPAPFLALGLVSAGWLAAALPGLIAAERSCRPEGDSPTHFDVRSDNICFVDGAARLVDWSGACLANGDVEIGAWLPSLVFEGGPPPEAILPGRPDIAAFVSGYFAARAGLPDIPDAPFVRRVQRKQVSTALPWAIRALRLDAPS